MGMCFYRQERRLHSAKSRCLHPPIITGITSNTLWGSSGESRQTCLAGWPSTRQKKAGLREPSRRRSFPLSAGDISSTLSNASRTLQPSTRNSVCICLIPAPPRSGGSWAFPIPGDLSSPCRGMSIKPAIDRRRTVTTVKSAFLYVSEGGRGSRHAVKPYKRPLLTRRVPLEAQDPPGPS